MNLVTLFLGLAAVLFGIFSIYLRLSDPSKLGKLEAMKMKLGESAGNTIHLFAYTVVPIVFGAMMIVIGLSGGSLF